MELPEGCVAACPGCRHRGWPEARSRRQKEAWLSGALAPWRQVLGPLETADAAGRWGYREKVTLTAGWASGGWRLGMMRYGDLVPIPHCPVHSPRVRLALACVTPVLPGPAAGFALKYYVQAGAQVVLVLKQAKLPGLDWLSPEIKAGLTAAGVEGLWLNLYPAAGRNRFSKAGWRLVWGRPRSTTRDGLFHGPGSFQQLIPELHGLALDQAEAFLAPRSRDRVADLYCGIGASLRRWVAGGTRAVGVESSGEAVECAGKNAPGAALLRGRCAQRLPQIDAFFATQAGGVPLVHVNPPRTGLEPEVTDWLAHRARPARVTYLSCSTGTLARDLARLTGAGYGVEGLRPFDFFPQTHHVETLALLRRRD